MDCVQLNGRTVESLKMTAPPTFVIWTFFVLSTTPQSQLACVNVRLLVPCVTRDVMSRVSDVYTCAFCGLPVAGNSASSWLLTFRVSS